MSLGRDGRFTVTECWKHMENIETYGKIWHDAHISAKLSIRHDIQRFTLFYLEIENLGPFSPGKANPNSADEQGHVAINDAVAKDRFDLVTKLLEYGALVPWLRMHVDAKEVRCTAYS